MLALYEFLYSIDPERVKRAVLEVLLVMLVYAGVAVAATWPTVMHLDEVVLGGGELGGWIWRQWWHFQEIEALGQSDDLGWIDKLSLLIGLGRYPETGNILDILLLSYPLDRWLGFPTHHNVKVLVILAGNGMCGYALARSFTDSRSVALAAGLVAVLNPIVFQDINKTGLRQVLLWWLLLYPVFLRRAQRTQGLVDGLLAGGAFALVAAFYWFYGLFAAMFTVVHVGAWIWREKPGVRDVARAASPALAAAVLGVLLFVSPYLSSDASSTGQGGVEKLPEVTFFLSFPAYDTIADTPLRPSNYRENVLSSLHRTIDSAWPADYVMNPKHGVLAMPVVTFILGILPAIFIKRARPWLLVWLVFWLGTLGPFLKLGAGKDTAEVIQLGDYVVRLPYALMFKFVPGMSRMFAPYRMASMVVVATVALLAIALDGTGHWRRRGLAAAAFLAIGLQPFYRFDLETVREDGGGPAMWRIPTQTSSIALPEWYAALDPALKEGIIELPLEQQQDILTLYQSFHRRKVYRSWATTPAIPPAFRDTGGGRPAARLRWLAKPEPSGDKAEEPLRALSREPLGHTARELEEKALERLIKAGGYRWLVVHERGYYLVEPTEGATMYRYVVRSLSERFGIEPVEMVEHEAHDWPGKSANFPAGPAWIPWSSREVHLPGPQMPDQYFMAVFDLSERGPAPEGPAPEPPGSSRGPAEDPDAEPRPPDGPPPEGGGDPGPDGVAPPPENPPEPPPPSVDPPPPGNVGGTPPPEEREAAADGE